jgi:hypothetical protein
MNQADVSERQFAVAIHESGHAVAAAYARINVAEIWLSRPDPKSGGHMKSEDFAGTNRTEFLAVFLAGDAAVEELCGACRLEPDGSPNSDGALFRNYVKQLDATTYEIRIAEQTARRIVQKHKKHITAIANALIARQQGFLDALLHGLEVQFEGENRPDLDRLRHLSETLSQSLYLTPPRPTAVPDPDLTLQALYKAYVAPISAPRTLPKGVVIDNVVQTLRRRGFQVRRSEYIGDFVFDALVDRAEGVLAFDVLSFATPKKDWIPAERDAGHFLYGLERLGIPGIAVIQAPSEETREEASSSFERVRHWFEEASVPVRDPAELADKQMVLTTR